MMDDQKKTLMREVGTRIRYFRHAKGLSQEDLALRANINPAYLGQLERGLKCPTVDTLYKISCALSVPLTELLQSIRPIGAPPPDIDRLSSLLAYLPDAKRNQILDIIEAIIKLY